MFRTFVLSSEQTFNHKKSRKTRKNDKVNQNKEKNDKEAKKEQSQKMKLPEPIIYDPDRKQENTLLIDDNNSLKKDQERINSEAKEITKYYKIVPVYLGMCFLLVMEDLQIINLILKIFIPD